MSLWLTLAVNSVALGGLLFLLSSGFSLIFGLMRIPNLMHGSFFMLGAYFGVTLLWQGVNFWVAALLSAAAMALIGGLIERFLLRRLAGEQLPQVLLTLGFAFIIGDICLMLWTGDPWQPATPAHLQGAVQVAGLFFPLYRLIIWRSPRSSPSALVDGDWTRLALIRAASTMRRSRGGYQGLAALRWCSRSARRWRLRRRDGGTLSLGVPGPRLRDASPGAHRRHPRRCR
jgi:branched-chain amino acid transport system permease protein